jgi:hypothetical protein
MLSYLDAAQSSGLISRKALRWLAVPAVIAALLLAWRWSVQREIEGQRNAWKDVTISRLAALSMSDKKISAELATLSQLVTMSSVQTIRPYC